MLPEIPSYDASGETRDKLAIYFSLLRKWQKSVNLVAPASLSVAEKRHFEDSLQLLPLIHSEATIMDIGSGAGFPGLVLAAAKNGPVHMVESDMKKCQFLRTVSREANIPVTIHNCRIENVDKIDPDYITARALADLKQLLAWTEKWWSNNKKIKILLLKGEKLDQEIEEAGETYSFGSEIYQSKTDPSGRIILLTNVSRIS